MVAWLAGKWLKFLVAFLMGAGAVGLVWYHGYQTGAKDTVVAYTQQIEDYQKAQRKMANELEQLKMERLEETRAKVSVASRELDPTGCGDVRVPDRVLDASGYVDP